MDYLLGHEKINKEKKKKLGRLTSLEIQAQPKTWKATFNKILNEKENFSSFLNEVLDLSDLQIVITGAGSSGFIGDVIASTWKNLFFHSVQAIPTTELVTHFENKILTDAPLLLISIARSGNSPESTATFRIANELCDNVYHLIITCNPNGQLAAKAQENTYIFLLPPKAEDKSLAMTNSFTSMALAGSLIPRILKGDVEAINSELNSLIRYGENILRNYTNYLFEISKIDFDRVVFLGSGSKLGIAKESHLKVQELTNGEIIGKFDSFLGFRHGPKSIINKNSLIVYLLSNNSLVHKYERDLIRQINEHNIPLTTFLIAESEISPLESDYSIILNDSSEIDDDLWSIICSLPAQIIGFYKSLALSYNPDNPSPNRMISRVVEGVTIYDYA